MQQRTLVFFVLVVLLAICSGPGWTQGPETYAMPHLFGLPNATPVRASGMGGIMACVQGDGFPNPAFAGALESAHAGVMYSLTGCDTGLKLKGTQVWVNSPLADGGQGIQIVGYHLDSGRGQVNAGGVPLAISVHENDLAFHYGRRFGEYWLVGLGVSPVLHTTTNYFSPLDGSLVAHLDSSAGFGGRVGALYQFQPDGFAGLIFDRYTEDVNLRSVVLPAPMAVEFTSTELAFGVSGRVDDRVLAAAEWAELRSKSGALESKTSGLRLGAEFAAAENVEVRAGLNDGSLWLGGGYQSEAWKVEYAYGRDWNDDAVGAVLGGSDTHQVEATRTW